jgi:hypothetical protein
MSQRKWMAAVVAFLLLVPAIEAEQAPDGKRLKELITQLGSREFREREEATTKLIAVGASALELLQNATSNSDAEIRRRASWAIERIERKIETDRLLKPKKVHLSYQNTPITEAVADFAKKSGYPIQFEGDRIRLASRKITLDTGEVSFWEALDQFCRVAGLLEQRASPPANPGAQGLTPQEMERRLWERRMSIRRGSAPPARVDFGRIVLVDGKTENLSTFQMGAVRIRVLPANTQLPGHGKTPEESFVTLEVTTEAGVDWRGVLEVHVQKAFDLKGREAAQVQESTAPSNGPVIEWGGGVALNLAVGNNGIIFADALDSVAPSTDAPTREFPVRFKLAERGIKELREIQGVLFAQVQTPQEPLIRADKILQAEGKTFKGPADSFLKIHEVRQNDRGQVQMRVTLRRPSMSEEALAMMGGAVFVRRFNGRMAFLAQQEMETVAAQNLSLHDSKGQAFQLTSAEESTQANGVDVTQEFRLVFQSRQGLDQPARLVYSGHRLVTVEIPFTLKNVPLRE